MHSYYCEFLLCDLLACHMEPFHDQRKMGAHGWIGCELTFSDDCQSHAQSYVQPSWGSYIEFHGTGARKLGSDPQSNIYAMKWQHVTTIVVAFKKTQPAKIIGCNLVASLAPAIRSVFSTERGIRVIREPNSAKLLQLSRQRTSQFCKRKGKMSGSTADVFKTV